jgi:cation transport ATPase
MENKTQKYIFHVQGMHCKACGLLITGILSEASSVHGVKVDEYKHQIEIETISELAPEELALELTKLLAKDGYSLSVEKKDFKPKWQEFIYAVPAVIVFVLVFIGLQKAGLANLITSDKVSLPVAFGIGLVASVSSCLAVVGGLLLSVSANYAKEGEKNKPQILFHLGRLISFLVFGGIIGLIGSAFTLNTVMMVIISLLVGLVMLSLGINLLDIFPWGFNYDGLRFRNSTSFGPY